MGIMGCVWAGDQKGLQGIQRDPLNPLLQGQAGIKPNYDAPLRLEK
jgi:hypothetical protein